MRLLQHRCNQDVGDTESADDDDEPDHHQKKRSQEDEDGDEARIGLVPCLGLPSGDRLDIAGDSTGILDIGNLKTDAARFTGQCPLQHLCQPQIHQ